MPPMSSDIAQGGGVTAGIPDLVLAVKLGPGQALLQDKGIQAELTTKAGNPIEEIVRRTSESTFDLVVIGAASGIGKFTAAAAEGIARQPAAAAQISGAISLPLFLLEGVAVLAEVFTLLIVLK